MPPAALYEPDDDAFDPSDPREIRPAERMKSRRLPWLRMSLMSGVAVFGLVYLAQQRERTEAGIEPGAVPAAVLIAPPPTWQPIASSAPAYEVEPPEGGVPIAASARRHASGGREDTLVIGSFGSPGHGRISVERNIAAPQPGSFYVDLVRRAAEAGLAVMRSAPSRPVATKFGLVEVAPVIFAESAEQSCLAFRYAHGELAFGFRGWLCGSEAKPASEIQLACFVDRLALAKGADDPALKVLFAQADRRRSEACAAVARLEPSKSKSATRS